MPPALTTSFPRRRRCWRSSGQRWRQESECSSTPAGPAPIPSRSCWSCSPGRGTARRSSHPPSPPASGRRGWKNGCVRGSRCSSPIQNAWRQGSIWMILPHWFSTAWAITCSPCGRRPAGAGASIRPRPE